MNEVWRNFAFKTQTWQINAEWLKTEDNNKTFREENGTFKKDFDNDKTMNFPDDRVARWVDTQGLCLFCWTYSVFSFFDMSNPLTPFYPFQTWARGSTKNLAFFL
jgi:hypothetical protein